jgi:hypothetical protein
MHSAHTQWVCLQGAVNECTPYSTVSTLALGFLPSNSVNSCPVHFYRQTVSTLALFISTFKQCYLLPCSFLPSNSVNSCPVHFYRQTVSTLALFISTFKQCYLLPCSFLPSVYDPSNAWFRSRSQDHNAQHNQRVRHVVPHYSYVARDARRSVLFVCLFVGSLLACLFVLAWSRSTCFLIGSSWPSA